MASQGVADVVTAIVAELAEKGGHGLAAGHEQFMMATTIASTEVSIPTNFAGLESHQYIGHILYPLFLK